MKESVTISTIPKTDAENYDLLREKGISFLQAFNQNRWTDYNIHDPGVTILELLCYALTDLGYRTTFDFADIVTPYGGAGPDFTSQFYRAQEILPCHPVTINDYRRLVLDVFPGIRNVWIKPKNAGEISAYEPNLYIQALEHELTLDPALAKPQDLPLKLKGLYQVKLELENLEITKSDYHNWHDLNCYTREYLIPVNASGNEVDLRNNLQDIYSRGVLNLLMDYRNLCEDFVDISFSETEKVSVCADIEVSPGANLQQIWFQIYEVLLNYISPAIAFYSVKELLAKGKTIEEILEGYVNPQCYMEGILSPPAASPPSSPLDSKKPADEALLKKAFIDADELEKFNKREIILVSDLVNLIMDIEGIVTVKSLTLNSYDDDGPIIFATKNDFCLHLKDPGKSFEFILDYFLPVAERQNKIVLYKGLIPYKIPPEGIGKDVTSPLSAGGRIKGINYSNGRFNDINNTEFLTPSGSYRYLEDYYPVQNDFPPAYLVGKEGISNNATALRKSQRLQLKGYLMFYEQILANFLAQVNHITDLLSWTTTTPQSYFSQQVRNIKDLGKLIDYSVVNNDTLIYSDVFESDHLAVQRKNRFLNHLLARFNENFEELSLLKLSYSADAASSPEISVADQKVIIGDKVAFLGDYIKVSRDRSHAFNYTTRYSSSTEFWDSSNISGLELRAGRKLGIDTVRRRKLLKSSGNCEDPSINEVSVDYDFEKDFGFHIVEHLLLRPGKNFKKVVADIEHKDHFLSLCCCESDDPGAIINYCDDPYSLRLTIVFPGWDNYNPKWQSYEQYIQFRKFVEQTIREEAPAHVTLKICWISACQMEEFEKAYEPYFSALALSLNEDKVWNHEFDDVNYYEKLRDLIQIMNKLKNHYKGGYLHDCNLKETDKRPFVLNSTVLGGRD